MNNEDMPRYLRAYREGYDDIEVYDPEHYTVAKGDVEYVRSDMLFEALAERGWDLQITVTPKESQDGQSLYEKEE